MTTDTTLPKSLLSVQEDTSYQYEWKPRIHIAPLTCEPGRAVALGLVLVRT
jgi:hypothetical protein